MRPKEDMLKSLSIVSRFRQQYAVWVNDHQQYAVCVNDSAWHKHCNTGSVESGEPHAVDNTSETLSVYCNVFIYMFKTFLRFALLLLLLIIVYFFVYSSKVFLPLLYFPDWASVYRYRPLSISSDLLVNWWFRDVCMFACALLLALERLVCARFMYWFWCPIVFWIVKCFEPI